MSMLKLCSLVTQNMGCILYMSASYTRDGTVHVELPGGGLLNTLKISQDHFWAILSILIFLPMLS